MKRRVGKKTDQVIDLNHLTDDLMDSVFEVLDQCLANGMKPPFIVCFVGTNGSVVAARFVPHQCCEMLAKHFEPRGMQLPINMMIVDQTGDAARAVATVEGVHLH